MKKQCLGVLLLVFSLSVTNAQQQSPPQETFKPGLSLALNVSQWLVGQQQIEVEQRFKNTPYAINFQVFGGNFNRKMVFSNGSDFDTLHGVSTLGFGLGIRRYEKANSEGFFSQLSVYYKDVTKTYSRLETDMDWFNFQFFSPPNQTYMRASDRMAGVGTELLGGYRFLHERFFVEANAGLIVRFLQPQGPYLGELSPWRFRWYANTSGLDPIMSLRIGVQL